MEPAPIPAWTLVDRDASSLHRWLHDRLKRKGWHIPGEVITEDKRCKQLAALRQLCDATREGHSVFLEPILKRILELEHDT